MNTSGTGTEGAGKTRRIMELRIFLLAALILSTVSLYAEGNMMGGKTEPLAGAEMSSRGYARIDADKLMQEMMMKDFELINVHIPYGGEITGTDANIPYNKVADITAKYPDKEQTLVLYCRSGSMSAAASAELASLGYKNIIELKGGYNAWQRAGGEMMMR